MENHTAVNINGVIETLNDDASQWSNEEVKLWLRRNGYKEVEVRKFKIFLKIEKFF